MSHVAEINIEVRDLDALIKAATDLGLEADLDARTFRWFGTHVGDYPLPAGFAAADMGKCDVGVLRVPGNSGAYEVGVCTRRDGKPGYTLLWDFWQGGYGLQNVVGRDGQHLVQGYAEQVVLKQARAQGLTIAGYKTLSDGSKQVLLRTV